MQIRSKSVALAAVLALAAGLTAAAPSALAKGRPPKPPKHGGGDTSASPLAFTAPLTLPGGGAEPSIRNPKDGAAAYVSAPAVSGSNFWRIDEVTNPDGSTSFKSSARQDPDLGTGGGDSEISVADTIDPATGCAPIAYSGLHNIDLLTNFTTAKSTDCGRTFSNPPMLFGVQNVGVDRQWQTFDGGTVNYLLYHKIDTSQIVVSRSEDAGGTYISLDPTGVRGVVDPATMPNVVNDNQIGNIVTDYSQPVQYPLLTNPTQQYDGHALYAIFGGPRDPADALNGQTGGQVGDAGGNVPSYNHVDTIYVGKSLDGGLTWTDTKVFGVDPSTNRELNLLFPVIAVDKGGNLYATWSDGLRVEYSVSSDHGATWSKPYLLNTPASATADIFPWMVGGGDGRLDVVWYHGTGCKTAGCNTKYRDPGDEGTTWTVAFTQLADASAVDANGVPTPTVVDHDDAVTPVMHKGDICNNGTACILGGDRTLLDFFQVSIDPAGRANIAYASDLNPDGSKNDLGFTQYTRQNGGTSALDGTPITAQNIVPIAAPKGTSCPGPQVMDFTGDAFANILVNPTGPNEDADDIVSAGLSTASGKLQVTLTLKDLSTVPAGANTERIWIVHWTYGGKTYFVRAEGAPGDLVSYDAGEIVDDGVQNTDDHVGNGAVPGTFTPGPNGTITWTVDDPTLVGSPPTGAVLTSPYATSNDTATAAGIGLIYPIVDQAPDSGGGEPYTVGAC